MTRKRYNLNEEGIAYCERQSTLHIMNSIFPIVTLNIVIIFNHDLTLFDLKAATVEHRIIQCISARSKLYLSQLGSSFHQERRFHSSIDTFGCYYRNITGK